MTHIPYFYSKYKTYTHKKRKETKSKIGLYSVRLLGWRKESREHVRAGDEIQRKWPISLKTGEVGMRNGWKGHWKMGRLPPPQTHTQTSAEL